MVLLVRGMDTRGRTAEPNGTTEFLPDLQNAGAIPAQGLQPVCLLHAFVLSMVRDKAFGSHA